MYTKEHLHMQRHTCVRGRALTLHPCRCVGWSDGEGGGRAVQRQRLSLLHLLWEPGQVHRLLVGVCVVRVRVHACVHMYTTTQPIRWSWHCTIRTSIVHEHNVCVVLWSASICVDLRHHWLTTTNYCSQCFQDGRILTYSRDCWQRFLQSQWYKLDPQQWWAWVKSSYAYSKP